jgi:hypothetical protein
MEQELNYLSEKIEELENEVSYYTREVAKTESEKTRTDINNILERKETELEILQNILSVVVEHEVVNSL